MDEDNDLTESAARVDQLPADGTPNITEHVSRVPLSGSSPQATSSITGPAVLAQPPVGDLSNASAERGEHEGRPDANASRLTLDVVKGAFVNAQDAVTSGYRSVSSSTDDFVRQKPWNAVALAVLGGVVVGMLASRRWPVWKWFPVRSARMRPRPGGRLSAGVGWTS
jgi:ElaB protein